MPIVIPQGATPPQAPSTLPSVAGAVSRVKARRRDLPPYRRTSVSADNPIRRQSTIRTTSRTEKKFHTQVSFARNRGHFCAVAYLGVGGG